MRTSRTPTRPDTGIATALASLTTSVNVSNAAAPVAGQTYIADGEGGGAWEFPFAMRDDLANAKNDYSASGVYTSTTTASSTNAGSTTVYLTDASTFKRSQGISIVGAGSGGVDHTTTIASVNTASNYVVLNVATVTTVGSGAVVYHDDTVALQNMIDDGALADGYMPVGDFITTGPLNMTKFCGILLGNNWAGLQVGGSVGYPFKRQSIIYTRFNTYDGLYVGSDAVTISGFTLAQHPSITRTAGVHLRVGPNADGDDVYEINNSNVVNFGSISRIKIDNPWIGVQMGQTWSISASEIFTRMFRKDGLVIDRKVPYGGDAFDKLWFVGYGTTGTTLGASVNAGVKIVKSDHNMFSLIKTYRTYHGIQLASVAGAAENAIGQQSFTQCALDNIIGGYGFYNKPMNSYQYSATLTNSKMNVADAAGAVYLGANSRRCIVNNNSWRWGGTPGDDIIDLGTGNVTTPNSREY